MLEYRKFIYINNNNLQHERVNLLFNSSAPNPSHSNSFNILTTLNNSNTSNTTLKHTNVQTFGTNYTNLPPAAINSFTPTILNIKTTDSNPITSITNIIKLNKLHSSNVTCICPLGNNKIITGSSNGSISLCTCNYLNKKCELLFKKEDIHKKAITSICKLDSDRFITASKDSIIKAWKLHTNTDISLIQTMTSHTQEITKVILLNENKLISCSLDNTIKLWETKYPFENIKNNYENVLVHLLL
jgi:WD40 repeat protein